MATVIQQNSFRVSYQTCQPWKQADRIQIEAGKDLYNPRSGLRRGEEEQGIDWLEPEVGRGKRHQMVDSREAGYRDEWGLGLSYSGVVFCFVCVYIPIYLSADVGRHFRAFIIPSVSEYM